MNLNSQCDVSVIIPTYNVEKYIEQCLQSLVAQNYRNFEVICVDDGSTDGTKAVIERFVKQDRRIQLLEHPHCGKAGVMRNEGMKKAVGEYCLFLDGDDFFEPDLIGHALKRAREDQADVCLFDARTYYENTGTFYEPGNMLKKIYAPKRIPYEGKSFPYVFNISTGCPWTKLFRRSFILENHLEFMPLCRSNDLYFVCMALALSERTTILEEKLVNYRKSEGSLQTNNADTPLDWYQALLALKKGLEEKKIYRDTRLSFQNYVIDVGFYNLEAMHTPEAFSRVYETMKQEMLEKLELEEFSREQCYDLNKEKYQRYLDMKACTEKEFLFRRVSSLKEENLYWSQRARKAELDAKSNVLYRSAKSLWIVLRRMSKRRK